VTLFLRILSDLDKSHALSEVVLAARNSSPDERIFTVAADVFGALPGAPFAYWATDSMRSAFKSLNNIGSGGRLAQHGGSTKEDFRFLRVWWELDPLACHANRWFPFAKGGAYSPFYADVYLAVNWENDARELEASLLKKYPYLGETANWVLHRECNYLSPGLTWSRRTKTPLSMRVLPSNCIFADKGPSLFAPNNDEEELLWILSITSSRAFYSLVELQLAAGDARPGGAAHSFEVGIIGSTPLPNAGALEKVKLASLARRAWSLKRSLDTVEEVSHAFILPSALQSRVGLPEPASVSAELANIREEIDEIAFNLYGFSNEERSATLAAPVIATADSKDEVADIDDNEDDDSAPFIDQTDSLLSWAIGVSFGRFDWRLATRERKAPSEPAPFDPLPGRSPGMLPEGAAPFHAHNGILVDDQGHPHDLPRLIEEALARVDTELPGDVRRWLRRDFFPLHLKQYSKSRRKAPIYWPLSTASGSYTLWLYYPSLTSQTLYTAINDFIEGPKGKLQQVGRELSVLRDKGSTRSRDDEKAYEALQALELELIELRDTLLKIAPTYRPNHDDGVQIAAAPLWQLFHHKPWHKILKDTWAKLEKGGYDWAPLAMAYWPDRVKEKCKTDKSLAIAHDVEHLYVEPEAKNPKARGRQKGSDA